jgi:predicted CXXCH cytochrome family protein
MKRYPFIALIIILTIWAFVACNGNGPIIPGEPVTHFVSAQVCSACHIEKAAEWSQTGHHRAWTDLLAEGEPASYCIPCHVVGLDSNPANSGYDDPDPEVAARFVGVQCESCHGMGSDHIKNFEPLDSSLSSEVCAQCHDGAHHPTYTEWQQSLHAVALDARDHSGHFTTECLRCHSADYIFADSVPDTATPADFQLSLTCVVCHDPHSEENDFQLRMDIVSLCSQCHNDEEAIPGESPHHSNSDMYRGIGGYEYPGKTYENSYHTFLEDGCAACHMYTAPFDPVNNTAISGHTFKPRLEACNECHPGTDTFDRDGTQTMIHGLLDTLKAELDSATDADKLTLSYERAMFNYNFCAQEGSYGIHNTQYAVALLSDSIADFTPGS